MERELWNQLYVIVARLDTFWTNGLYRNAEIVVVYLWAVIHDRPTSWTCESKNWDADPPRRLPPQCTMSRRLRSRGVGQLLDCVEAELGGDPQQWWVQRIDSKPLPIGPHSKDTDAKCGRAAGGFARGYKLHAVAAPRHQIVAPPRRGKNVGRRRHEPSRLHHEPSRIHSVEITKREFGRALLRFRVQIERCFGNLTSFAAGLGPLPSWVRRPHRVKLWVQAKLLINALRQLNRRSRKLAPA